MEKDKDEVHILPPVGEEIVTTREDLEAGRVGNGSYPSFDSDLSKEIQADRKQKGLERKERLQEAYEEIESAADLEIIKLAGRINKEIPDRVIGKAKQRVESTHSDTTWLDTMKAIHDAQQQGK